MSEIRRANRGTRFGYTGIPGSAVVIELFLLITNHTSTFHLAVVECYEQSSDLLRPSEAAILVCFAKAVLS